MVKGWGSVVHAASCTFQMTNAHAKGKWPGFRKGLVGLVDSHSLPPAVAIPPCPLVKFVPSRPTPLLCIVGVLAPTTGVAGFTAAQLSPQAADGDAAARMRAGAELLPMPSKVLHQSPKAPIIQGADCYSLGAARPRPPRRATCLPRSPPAFFRAACRAASTCCAGAAETRRA